MGQYIQTNKSSNPTEQANKQIRQRKHLPCSLSCSCTCQGVKTSSVQTNKRQTKARIESGPTNPNKQIKQSNRSNQQNRQAAAFLAFSHDSNKKNKQETSRSELVRARMSASGSLSKRKARKRALRILNQAGYYAADRRKF